MNMHVRCMCGQSIAGRVATPRLAYSNKSACVKRVKTTLTQARSVFALATSTSERPQRACRDRLRDHAWQPTLRPR